MNFHFPCPVCQAPLQAYIGSAGEDVACPICGQAFPIPRFDPVRRRLEFDPARTPKPPAESMAYLHAYACNGAAAPRVVRDHLGHPHIQCTRCHGFSAPVADFCSHCRAPFAVESGVAVVQPSSGPWGCLRAFFYLILIVGALIVLELLF